MPLLTLQMTGSQVASKGFAGDRPPPGAQIGHELSYTDDFKVGGYPTIKSGQQSGFCHLVRRGGPHQPGWWLCQAGYILPPDLPTSIPSGRLNHFHGLTLTSFEPDPNAQPPVPDLGFVSAIIGGTGAYKNARGQLRGIAARPNNLSWTVEIEY